MAFHIRELSASEANAIVAPLYSLEGNGIGIRDTDLFFAGFLGEELEGSVRFCVEQETPMLRTMRVARKFHGQGYGGLILKHFESYLEPEGVEKTYCLPYAHLENFYGQIGFQVVEKEEAPAFLQERLKEYRQRPESFLCMCRRSFTPRK